MVSQSEERTKWYGTREVASELAAGNNEEDYLSNGGVGDDPLKLFFPLITGYLNII